MEGFEQENVELRSTVTTLQEEVERLTSLVNSLAAAQSQQATLSNQNQTAISEVTTTPVSTVAASSSPFSMPEGYPWGMSFNFGIEFRQPTSQVQTTTLEVPTLQQNSTLTPQRGVTLPQVTMTVSQPIMTNSASVVHTTMDEEVHHIPGNNTNSRGSMENLQEQLLKMQLEIKTIRGKELFGKNAQDLCLVPRIRIPAKFKVPDFEKYKGNSCPQSHLTMYARKMSTYNDD